MPKKNGKPGGGAVAEMCRRPNKEEVFDCLLTHDDPQINVI